MNNKLHELKIGQLFRVVGEKPVWKFEGYDTLMDGYLAFTKKGDFRWFINEEIIIIR